MRANSDRLPQPSEKSTILIKQSPWGEFWLDSHLMIRPVLIRFNKHSWGIRLVVLSDKISARAEDAKSPQEPHMKFSALRLLLLAFAFTPVVLLAQDTAQITGTVTDPSGAAVSGAQVTLRSVGQGTTHTATANSSGDYLFSALPVGA